jgi:hypothetical protein
LEEGGMQRNYNRIVQPEGSPLRRLTAHEAAPMKEIQIYISAMKIIPPFFLFVKILFVILQIFVEFY